MATATESPFKLFEQTIENMRRASESTLQTQQEVYSKWSHMWPGAKLTKTDWATRVQTLQKEWATSVTETMKRQGEQFNEQYQASVESLEEALRVAALEDPEEMREGYEALCRKTMDLMKATSEKQIQQFQEAFSKWIELCQMKS